jgi:hypothetical protein
VATALLDGEGRKPTKTKNKQEICSEGWRGIHVARLPGEQNQEGRNMKRTAQIAVIGALLAVGIAESYAQSNAVVVSQLSVALSGFSGDTNTAKAVKISNKDIINALNASSSAFTFSKAAKLMIGVPAAGGSPSFFVRDGKTDTDVSSFFGTDSSDVVSNGRTQYEILHLTFNNGAGQSFDVNGAASDKIGKVTGKDTGVLDGQITSFTSTQSGTGEVDSTFTVLKGTANASGAKGELH